MYIFGGKDEDNEKLRDFWRFDFKNKTWEELDVENPNIASRSGHSACIFQDHMIIFAGIHEVTKELDDMAAYSFKQNRWFHLFREPVASKGQENSPITKVSTTKIGGGISPSRPGLSPMKMKTLNSTKQS